MTNKNKKNKCTTYYVNGMHCSACELIVKQDIDNIKGVKDTKVSLKDGQVKIYTEDKNKTPSINELNKIFKDSGYTFNDKKVKNEKINFSSAIKVILLAFSFILSFHYIEKSGFFMKYSLNAQSSWVSYFVFGLAAGLSSCAALVGGILLSLSKNWNNLYGNNSKKSYIPFIYFNLARLITFALFGGVIGYLGSLFKLSITSTAVVTIIISIIMIIIALQMLGINWFNRFKFNNINIKYFNKNNNFTGKYIPILIGGSTFFVPCGFTIIAQTNTLTASNFYEGMINLGAFALGTLPVLALISFSSVKFYSNKKFSKMFSMFSAIIIMFFALYTLNSQLNVLGLKSLNDLNKIFSKSSEEVVLNENIDTQYIKMTAQGFKYLPTEFTIKSGVKTIWEIDDKGSAGCARAVFARGLYPDVINIKPGLTTVEFIAPKPGVYKISCSMGMVPPVTVRVIE